ncbi:cytochrome c oxidase assembly protein [Pikeienuella piscinae]|uniref:Cytochrome c oxidase assembly protein CtaG n=1 Tax=Pikeienuella piscinae TaxID=2748098 RepID=A0A7L5BYN1_9RHOB|nr:cytochrome c oxidase assembly protein [Pikeienuella piscinae]QIE56233.1 cytochrome c oxidase assembly protein [Pikeienuella piscinae]
MSGRADNRKTLIGLAALGVVMLGMSFAAVPLYNLFCRVTGYAGTTATAEAGSDVILDREILVRFDGSLDRDMPWRFKPEKTTMKIRIGETGLAFYEATNPTDRVVAGAASYNVAPYSAGGYFTKIDCFCFTEQVLQPHQTVRMPVTFYVDPEITEDEEAKLVTTITLSYTFHEIEPPAESAALDRVDEAGPAG